MELILIENAFFCSKVKTFLLHKKGIPFIPWILQEKEGVIGCNCRHFFFAKNHTIRICVGMCQKKNQVETIMCAARSFCRLQNFKNYFWYFMCEKLNFFRKIRFVILTFTNSDIWIFALKIFSSISYSYVYYSHSICSRTQLVNAFD